MTPEIEFPAHTAAGVLAYHRRRRATTTERTNMRTRESIERLRQPKTKTIVVDGCEMTIRRLTAAEGQDLANFQAQEPAPTPVRIMARMAALSLANENGGREYPDDADERLADLPFSALHAIFSEACAFSGVGKAGQEAAAKN